MVRPRGTDSARAIQVIETKAIRGIGTSKDPVREVTQYWDLKGNFLAEMDTEMLLPQIQYEAENVTESARELQPTVALLANTAVGGVRDE